MVFYIMLQFFSASSLIKNPLVSPLASAWQKKRFSFCQSLIALTIPFPPKSFCWVYGPIQRLPHPARTTFMIVYNVQKIAENIFNLQCKWTIILARCLPIAFGILQHLRFQLRKILSNICGILFAPTTALVSSYNWAENLLVTQYAVEFV